MGYNTVAFALNDMMDTLLKAPKTTAHILCYGGQYEGRAIDQDWRRGVAKSNNEEPLMSQALRVESFHADETRYYRAGQNSMRRMEIVGYRTVKGKRVVMLALPDWAERYG
jgi:hypothetical protein